VAVARPWRIERAGGWYHVAARGNERRSIFRDDRRRDLVSYLGQRACGLKLGELVALTEMRDHGAVSDAIRRFETRLGRHGTEKANRQRISELSNSQM
jgi:hypothetical protein